MDDAEYADESPSRVKVSLSITPIEMGDPDLFGDFSATYVTDDSSAHDLMKLFSQWLLTSPTHQQYEHLA